MSVLVGGGKSQNLEKKPLEQFKNQQQNRPHIAPGWNQNLIFLKQIFAQEAKLQGQICKFYRDKKGNKLLTVIIKMLIRFARAIITSTAHASFVFLSSFRINLLAFYHECLALIVYVTCVLFKQ